MVSCGVAARRAARAAVHVVGATCAILLLVVVAASLTNKPVPSSLSAPRPSQASPATTTAVCLLDGFDGATSRRACNLAYLLGATSIFFNFLVVGALALAASGFRLPVVFETVVNAFLCLFWLGGGAAIAYFVLEANRGGWGGGGARAVVLFLAFFLGVLFLIAGWTAAVAAWVGRKHEGAGEEWGAAYL